MTWDVNININIRSPEVEQRLEAFMATVQEQMALMLDQVRAQGTRLQSLEVFVEHLYAAIRDKQLSAEDQSKIDEVFMEIQKNSATIEEAFRENTEPPKA
jgi:hypothetical protein